MTPQLRVSVISPFGVVGGAERWLLQLLDATSRLHVDAVIFEEGPLRAEFEARGIEVSVVPTGAGALDIARSLPALCHHLLTMDPDAVLANGVKAAAVALPASRITGHPSVWMKHDFSFDRKLARPLGAIADRVLANSLQVAQATRRTDVTLIPPPRPDGSPVAPAEARRYWVQRGALDPDRLTIGMATRLVPYKGVDDVIRALALPRASAWGLTVIGDDDPSSLGETARLRRLVDELDLSERVHFAGAVPNAGALLSGFDAVAVTTRRDERGFGGEGYSITALEALWCGVAVIGTDDSPELRRMATLAGVAVPPDDPEAIAHALTTLEHPQHRRELGAAGRAAMAEHPDASSCADTLTRVLAESAGRPGAALASTAPVTVLTPMKNEAGHLGEVVTAVLAQLEPEDEYLIVDDGSCDATVAELTSWMERDPRIVLVEGPGINAAAARNAGIARARHDVVVCTDAGCRPVTGWLQALRAPFEERDPPGLATGVYRVPASNPIERAFSAACFPEPDEARLRRPLRRAYGAMFGGTFSAERVDTRSMAVQVAAWRAVGGFREELYAAEDAAFGYAVAEAGWRLVLALDAEVAWNQRPDLRSMARMYRRYGYGGALAGERRLVAQDLLRASVYVAAPIALLKGGKRTRSAVAGGAISYMSLPLKRVVERRLGPPAAAGVPVALAVKDLSKAVGCLRGLVDARLGVSRW